MFINGQPLHQITTEILIAALEKAPAYSMQWCALTDELEYRANRS